jgi:uncharacterized protein (TIGR02246 family)
MMTRPAEADRAAILKSSSDLLSAVNAGDVDRVLAVWAEDGVMMPPHHPSVEGRDQLASYFRNLFSQFRFEFVFTSSAIQIEGDLAVERVTYTASALPLAGGPPLGDAGKGLHVYGRQRDGTWKLVKDIWNSDRPIARSA